MFCQMMRAFTAAPPKQIKMNTVRTAQKIDFLFRSISGMKSKRVINKPLYLSNYLVYFQKEKEKNLT